MDIMNLCLWSWAFICIFQHVHWHRDSVGSSCCVYGMCGARDKYPLILTVIAKGSLFYCTVQWLVYFFPLDNSKTRASTQPPDNDFRTKRCSFLSHRAESTEVAPLTLDRGFNDLKNFALSLWDTSKVSAWRSLNAMRPYFQSPIFWPVTSITWLGLETLRGKL